MSLSHDPAAHDSAAHAFPAPRPAAGPITITRAPGSVPDVPPDRAGGAAWDRLRVSLFAASSDGPADWQKVEPEPHHPPAPSSEEEGEWDLRADLVSRLGAAPSTTPDLVRHGPPPPEGEDFVSLGQDSAKISDEDLRAFAPLREPPARPRRPSARPASSASLHEPPARPRKAAAPRREPEPRRIAAPPREPRHDLFSPERQAQFLSALGETGSVRAACAKVGVSAQTAYLHRRRSARFAATWDGALVLARQVAEDVLAFRAIEGVEEPIFYRGEQVGSRLKFDARLLLAHLARLDAHVAKSVHGERRAARFDELLALVAGAEPPADLLPPGDPDHDGPGRRAGRWDAAPADPQLPPERADYVHAVLEDLPDRTSQRRRGHRAALAHDQWRDWRAAAEDWADRVTAPVAWVQRVVEAAEPVAKPVSAPNPAPVLARRPGRDTLLRTLSGVSTSALAAALSGGVARALRPVPPGLAVAGSGLT